MDRTDFLIHTGTNKSDTRFFHEFLNRSSSICLLVSTFLRTLFNNRFVFDLRFLDRFLIVLGIVYNYKKQYEHDFLN